MTEKPTRERLIEAAIAEIVERGWGGVRSRSVAERAGVNNALVHYHFGSMDELRLAAAATTFARVAAALGPDSMATPTIAEGIHTVAAGLTEVRPDDPIWQFLMEVFVQTAREPRLAEMALGWLDAYRRALRTRLDRAVAERELPDDLDTEGLAVALTAMFDGLGLHAYFDPDLDVARAGDAMAALLRPRKETT